MHRRHVLAIPALLAAPGVQAQDRKGDPLAPLAQCINRSEFKVKAQDRLPFANLKIERSAEGQFAADRETIVAQMQEMAATGKPPPQLTLETDARDGVEVPGLHSASIAQAPGIISLYSLLHAASRTVATACILNQPADPRDFSADGQYQALRDQRLASLVSCMACTALKAYVH